MARPQIIVNVDAAIQRRGAPTDTGTAFLVFAGATGPTSPTECYSAADATAASVPTAFAQYVGDVLTQGAPKVVVVRAAAVDNAAVTQAEWAVALAKLTADYGPGQVFIPGVSSTAAYNALLAHAAAFSRCVLLDGASTASQSTLSTSAASIASASGAQFATIVAGWVNVPASGGGTRAVPGSVIAAGLAARGDAARGHANQAPMFDQGRGAGVVKTGLSVSVSYTDAEADTLNDAGVSVIRMLRGVPTLCGWMSVSSTAAYKQLNWGRFAMQLAYQIKARMDAYLGQQIDGRGQLLAEIAGALRGYLLPLYTAGALYGSTASTAFNVDVSGVTSSADIQAGTVRATVEVSLSPHTETLSINVLTNIAQGVAA